MSSDTRTLFSRIGKAFPTYRGFRPAHNADEARQSSLLKDAGIRAPASIDEGTREFVAPPQHWIDFATRDTHVVTVSSVTGGMGRSTILASLASIISDGGIDVLVIDFDPCNVLSQYLGVPAGYRDGIVRRVVDGDDWMKAGLRCATHLQLLPFGYADIGEIRRFEQAMLLRPDWLRERVAEIEFPGRAIILIDAPPLPSLFAQQAIRAATLNAGVLRPDAGAPLRLARMDEWFKGEGMPYPDPIIMSGFHPAQHLHASVADLLRLQLKRRLAPFPIHHDSAVPEAMAAEIAVVDFAPHSQVAHDIQGLASALLADISARALEARG
ncbi:cellulose synthase operon protein YhjQ [Burkholderiaceae bacterium DAT-1]|nr:cellulose synthase operon protein YhjQ [Burkholderiaceae bacterium DAT-1]